MRIIGVTLSILLDVRDKTIYIYLVSLVIFNHALLHVVLQILEASEFRALLINHSIWDPDFSKCMSNCFQDFSLNKL